MIKEVTILLMFLSFEITPKYSKQHPKRKEIKDRIVIIIESNKLLYFFIPITSYLIGYKYYNRIVNNKSRQ